jgi:RNA polymerase sigma-70 factor (ECF subfamily)
MGGSGNVWVMGSAGGDHDGRVIAGSISEPHRFTEIFERHFTAIHRYTARRLGPGPADDVAATVFVEAFSGRARFDVDRPDARPWLYGIATNLVRRHRRTESRRLRAYARAEAPPDGEPIDIAPRLDAEAMGPRLAAALAALADRDRDALLLYAWAGLPYEDIAAATDVPIGTVRSRIPRARQRLRADLGITEPVGSVE